MREEIMALTAAINEASPFQLDHDKLLIEKLYKQLRKIVKPGKETTMMISLDGKAFLDGGGKSVSALIVENLGILQAQDKEQMRELAFKPGGVVRKLYLSNEALVALDELRKDWAEDYEDLSLPKAARGAVYLLMTRTGKVRA